MSAALDTFRRSMIMDYEKWHDGIGYDLEALQQLDRSEIDGVETILIDHLNNPGDWRDVEALHALGTPRAVAAVKGARQHRTAEVRTRAAELSGDRNDIEQAIVSGLFDDNGWSKALDLAEENATPAVKQALLDCARRGAPEARVNAAAMLLYVCGQAEEPFDWNHRPFFLRFGEDDAEVQSAWDELRRRTSL